MMTEIEDRLPEEEKLLEEQVNEAEGGQIEINAVVDIDIHLPSQVIVRLASVSVNEPLAIVKQSLSEYIESAEFTNYSLHLQTTSDESNDNKTSTKLPEFMEIGAITHESKLSLNMILEDYNVKQVRNHLKKVREILVNCPMSESLSFSHNWCLYFL